MDRSGSPFERHAPTPFGLLAAVDLTASLAGFEEELEPEERAHAMSLPTHRRETWLGGRVAMRRATRALDVQCPPIFATERGAPALPERIHGSIAHKQTVAVALAAPRADTSCGLGVDVEHLEPLRFDITRRVLGEGELARLGRIRDVPADHVVRVAFAVKEAVYKAIDPTCRRYVAFREVEVDVDACAREGEVEVVLGLDPAAPARLYVEARWTQLEHPSGSRCVIAMARAKAARG